MSWTQPKKQTNFNACVILINIVFIAIVGVFSSSSGFLGQSVIDGSLNLSQDDGRWITISLVMMLGIISPLSIFLAEKYGYKRIFFCGTLTFMLGSILNFTSFNFWSFFISRAIAGVGIGTLFPLSIAIIEKNFHPAQQKIALVIYAGLGFGIGMFFGLWGGGYLIQYYSWKSPYLISFLAGFPSLIITWLVHQETPSNPLKKFEFKGYFYFIVFISLLFIITVNAKATWNTEGWSSNFMVSCFFFLIISLILLIWTEIKSKNPIIVFSLFKIKSFSLGCIAMFGIGFFIYSTQILGILFFNQILHYEIETTGNYLSILGIMMSIVTIISTILTTFINVRLLTFVGLNLILLSCFTNPHITIYSNCGQVLSILTLRVMGIALAVGPATVLTMSEIPKSFIGAASMLVILIRQIGATLGSSIGNIIITLRELFHNQIFGANITPNNPTLQETSLNLKNHFIQTQGINPHIAEAKTKAIIAQNIIAQSLTTSINDFFFLAGIGTLFVSLALLCEWIYLKRMYFFQKTKN